MITLIEQACTAGARLEKACKVVGLSPRTVQRYRQEGQIKADGRKAAAVDRVPANRIHNAVKPPEWDRPPSYHYPLETARSLGKPS